MDVTCATKYFILVSVGDISKHELLNIKERRKTEEVKEDFCERDLSWPCPVGWLYSRENVDKCVYLNSTGIVEGCNQALLDSNRCSKSSIIKPCIKLRCKVNNDSQNYTHPLYIEPCPMNWIFNGDSCTKDSVEYFRFETAQDKEAFAIGMSAPWPCGMETDNCLEQCPILYSVKNGICYTDNPVKDECRSISTKSYNRTAFSSDCNVGKFICVGRDQCELDQRYCPTKSITIREGVCKIPEHVHLENKDCPRLLDLKELDEQALRNFNDRCGYGFLCTGDVQQETENVSPLQDSLRLRRFSPTPSVLSIVEPLLSIE